MHDLEKLLALDAEEVQVKQYHKLDTDQPRQVGSYFVFTVVTLCNLEYTLVSALSLAMLQDGL